MLLLGLLPYNNPYYLTKKQIDNLGGRIKKGESGNIVTFWKFPTEDQKNILIEAGKMAAPMFRFYLVWNIEQIEGIDFKIPQEAANLPEKNRQLQINDLQTIAGNMTADGVRITHLCPNYPCYIPAKERIEIPSISEFKTPENYYKTLFHEFVHATGHPCRLDREGISNYLNGKGVCKEKYAFEELVAELGTSFILNIMGIGFDQHDHLLQNAAAYIDSYITLLGSDRTLIVRAASKAQAAADYILGKSTLQNEED